MSWIDFEIGHLHCIHFCCSIPVMQLLNRTWLLKSHAGCPAFGHESSDIPGCALYVEAT